VLSFCDCFHAFTLERGHEDGQADTCRIWTAVNLQCARVATGQAQVPGQEDQERRQETGAFHTIMRRTAERIVEERIRKPKRSPAVNWRNKRWRPLNVGLVPDANEQPLARGGYGFQAKFGC
jgi:hypothetical protein